MKTDTRNLQLWPAGDGVTVRGGVHGLDLEIMDGDDWRKVTDEERRKVKIGEFAEMYCERDVLCCDSSLVDALQKTDLEGFQIDDLENLYPDPSEWDVDECREWLDDQGHTPPLDEDEIMEIARTLRDEHDSQMSDDTLKEKGHFAYIMAEAEEELAVDDWREAVTEQADAAEVYEWWRVTSWLLSELRDIGEVVIDNDYGEWWGRGTTGQGLTMDGVLQKIAASRI